MGEYVGAGGETGWKEAVPVPVHVSEVSLELTAGYVVGVVVEAGNGLP